MRTLRGSAGGQKKWDALDGGPEGHQPFRDQEKVEPQRINDWAAGELGGNAADTLEEDIVKREGPIEICAAKQVN